MPLFRLVAYLIIIEYGYTILCFYQPVLVGVSIHIDPVRMRGIRGREERRGSGPRRGYMMPMNFQ